MSDETANMFYMCILSNNNQPETLGSNINTSYTSALALAGLLIEIISNLSFLERWLNYNNKNLYTIEGYVAFHNVRCDGRRGGGFSLLYIFQMLLNLNINLRHLVSNSN